MPRIEFYVLPDEQPEHRLRVACVLAAKAWRSGLPVFLRSADESRRRQLDALLWSFRAERFIPHALYEDDPAAPVLIGFDQPIAGEQAVLINLDTDIPSQVPHVDRVIEIVNQQPELLNACRESFRSYRQQGYDPKRVEL